MNEILYRPEDCGKEVVNSRYHRIKIRKYHMTDEEKIRQKKRWDKDTAGVNQEIKDLAGSHFFNPYRKGIYYYQIQSLFLLGCNKWHSLSDIVTILSSIMSENIKIKNGIEMNSWEIFRNRSYQSSSVMSKSYLGKIQENMIFFQRLSRFHPYGYKLRQVFSAVDIKREDKIGFTNGLYSYRLSTYNSEEEALPIRDYINFTFPKHEHKYINYKFVGRIITRDKEIYKGKLV